MIDWQPLASFVPQRKTELPKRVLIAFGPEPLTGATRPVCEGFYRHGPVLGKLAGWVSCMDSDVKEPYLQPIAWALMPTLTEQEQTQFARTGEPESQTTALASASTNEVDA